MDKRKRRARTDEADALSVYKKPSSEPHGSFTSDSGTYYGPEYSMDFQAEDGEDFPPGRRAPEDLPASTFDDDFLFDEDPEDDLYPPARPEGYARRESGTKRKSARPAKKHSRTVRDESDLDRAFMDREPPKELTPDFSEEECAYERPPRGPVDRPGLEAARKVYEERKRTSAEQREVGGVSPNPKQPRRWPLYLFVTLTAALVFFAINIEQNRTDSEHWAASKASAINDTLVPRTLMGDPESLPTRIPQSYLDAEKAKFAINEELASPTPVATVAPVTSTPQVTKVPLLKKGMASDYVREVQEQLVVLGYLTADQVDGKYEGATIKAIQAFQDNSNLSPDGLAGKDTVEMLFRPNAIAAPTPSPEPTRLDEPYVWATANGKYYHSDKDCSNMKGALEIAISEAKANGKKACPVCDPPK